MAAEGETLQLIWKKYLPVITMKIKEAVRKNAPVSVKLYPTEFQQAVKKKKTVFTFELELRNGRIHNAARASVMAKYLAESMRQNPGMWDLMENQHYKFSLSEDFTLTIEQLPFVSLII